MNFTEVWKNTLEELQVVISKASFSTWFKNTFIYEYKKGVFTIGVPSFFAEDWLKKKYLKEIEKALKNQSQEDVLLIKFKIATPKEDQKIIISKDNIIHSPVDKSEDKMTRVEAVSLPQNSSLNPSYTFDSFIVGPSNQLAFAAAKAVAEKLGSHYNPLFIYGDSGLGKTHLVQAIGQQFLKNNPNKKVLYVSSETFVNEFIQAVSSGFGRAKDFKNRYRSIDVLLIDDIQFLETKEQTQDEFFHTFNHLYQNKKNVVLTSDRTPKEIKGLENRLKTRFEGGMVVDIGLPDLETREAILRSKAEILKQKIDNEVISYIASNVKSSIRELEGALKKLVATCELTNSDISLEKAKNVLANIITEKQQIVTPDLVIREVCKYFHLNLEDLLGGKRTRDLVIPRQITMYLLRHECNLSFPIIGRKLSGKDHSTIMYGCKKVEGSISTDSELKQNISNIKEKIKTIYN